MNLQESINLSLKTWYPKDHDLHHNLDHPTMKLAGEAGELLDLYAKHKYKPAFNWWHCKICKKSEIEHGVRTHSYTALVIDELGDWWYYWRILAYQSNRPLADFEEVIKEDGHLDCDMKEALISINYLSASILNRLTVMINPLPPPASLGLILYDLLYPFMGLIKTLGTDLDYITQSNYRKLNSEETNHGWRGAC
jgi:hypothetical protein